MARLYVGDALEVFLPEQEACTFGLIRFIGLVTTRGSGVQNRVGLELLEPQRSGHNGTVDGHRYFHAEEGHGMLVKLEDVIKKLTVNDLMARLKAVIARHRNKLKQRDAVIDRLRAKLSRRKTASASADISDDSDLERAFTEEKASAAMSVSRDVSDDSPKYADSPISYYDPSDDNCVVENDTSDDDSSIYSTSVSVSDSERHSARVTAMPPMFDFPDIEMAAVQFFDSPPVSVGESIELLKKQKAEETQLSAKTLKRIDAFETAKAKKKRPETSEPYTPEMASTSAERSRMIARREERPQKNLQYKFIHPMTCDSDDTDTSLSSDDEEDEDEEEDDFQFVSDMDSTDDSDSENAEEYTTVPKSSSHLQPPSSILSPKRPLPTDKRSTAPKKPASASRKTTGKKKETATKATGIGARHRRKRPTLEDSKSVPMTRRRLAKKTTIKRKVLKKPQPKQPLPGTPDEVRKKKARLAEQKKHALTKRMTTTTMAGIGTAIDSSTAVGSGKKKGGTKKKKTKSKSGKAAVTGKFGSGTRDSRELVGERSPAGDSTKYRGITSMADKRREKRYGGKLRRDADEYKLSSDVKSKLKTTPVPKRSAVVIRKRGHTVPTVSARSKRPATTSAKVLAKRKKKKKVKKKKSGIELKQSLEVTTNPYLDQTILTPTESLTETMPTMDFERHEEDRHYDYDAHGHGLGHGRERGRERVPAAGSGHSACKSAPVDFGQHYGSGHPAYGGGYHMPPSFVSTHGKSKKESTTTYTETFPIVGHHFV